MPWNDQSNNGQGPSPGGPWGSGPRTPWGQPQRPQRGQGPDLEDILRDFRERIRGAFGRGGRRPDIGGERRGPNTLALIAALVATAWLASGVYVVGAGSQAVVTRFGVYDRVTGPGLHAHMPLPFEQVQIENVTQPRETKIGVDQGGGDVPEESQMLTGDKSIIEINFTVLWTIANIRDYAFNVRDPRETVKAVAESAVREVVGRRDFDDVITRSRSEVEQSTLDLMQRMLEYYQAGIRVTTVQVDQARAPAEVAEAFRDVIKAGQDQITKRNE
ncbi:MAG: protease modulator HflK, partial [Hyphomonadaceae bacterium]